jgi:hypothetical protein
MTSSKKSITTSIVLLVVACVTDVLMFVPAFLLGIMQTACTAKGCFVPVFDAGVFIAMWGPGVVTLIGVIAVMYRIKNKQDSVSQALIALGGSVGAFFLGTAIVFLSVA